MIQPRPAELRAERESTAQLLTARPTPDQLSAKEIDHILDELGGLEQVLARASTAEQLAVYQGLGLRLSYQPDENVVVATADLGRVLSRVGGGT